MLEGARILPNQRGFSQAFDKLGTRDLLGSSVNTGLTKAFALLAHLNLRHPLIGRTNRPFGADIAYLASSPHKIVLPVPLTKPSPSQK